MAAHATMHAASIRSAIDSRWPMSSRCCAVARIAAKSPRIWAIVPIPSSAALARAWSSSRWAISSAA